MRSLAEWCSQLVCILLGFAALRVVVVERQRSIETPIPVSVTSKVDSAERNESLGSQRRPTFGAQGSTISRTWSVSSRLVDALDSAEVNVPSLDEPRMIALLKGYWRRVHSPLVGPKGSTARLVEQIGLSAVAASQPKRDDSGGSHADHWYADPRLWGLDEGTYDQREAILAPAPSRLTWRVNLQSESRFETSVAAFGAAGEAQFEVTVVSAGHRHSLGQKRLAQSRTWTDWTLDLSPFRGDIALELSTSAGHEVPISAWGSPIILSSSATKLPYNLLFVVVDAMRGDALASTHEHGDDSRIVAAPLPPFDAWLPRMPDVAPNLDGLANHGVTFARAYTAAMWTRPATLSMLTGMRAGRLGMPILELEPRPENVRAFYSLAPPLLPLLLRAQGAVTRAFINNMYLCGYVGVGIDAGFEALTDHRYQIKDTERITNDALAWLSAHRDERFALFINYVSPHAPYAPEPEYLEPIERARPHPDNKQVRRYLGEIRKDDAAIGRILEQLTRTGLTNNTLVVITADHGETMSEAHDWVAVDVAKGVHSGRFTHLLTMWEEAARVPIVFSLPGVIPENMRIAAHAQTTDIVPTVLDVMGAPMPSNLDGLSLKPLFANKPLAPRSMVIEGRGAQAIIDGSWHLIVRSPIAQRLQLGGSVVEKSVELYDLGSDPGERRDVSSENKEVVTRLKGLLEHQLNSVGTNTTDSVDESGERLHLRISSGPFAGKVVGHVQVLGEGSIRVRTSDPTNVLKARGNSETTIELELLPGVFRDLDLEVRPAGASFNWTWKIGESDWPQDKFYAGPLGVARPLARGLSVIDRSVLTATQFPYIEPGVEQGIFVTRDASSDIVPSVAEAAQLEAQQAMQAWGYVRRPETVRRAP